MDKVWDVTVKTPKGSTRLQVTLPEHRGRDSVERRVIMIAAGKGWGDIDEIEVTDAHVMESETENA